MMNHPYLAAESTDHLKFLCSLSDLTWCCLVRMDNPVAENVFGTLGAVCSPVGLLNLSH